MVLFYGVQIGHAALGGPTVRFLLLLFALLFAGYSHAATISVKSSGPNKPALVVVTGTLNIDDTNQFSAKVGRLSNGQCAFKLKEREYRLAKSFDCIVTPPWFPRVGAAR